MKYIPGFEELYSVTEDGQIWSHRHQKFMKSGGRSGGYQVVYLVNKEHRGRSYYVHRAVAMAYLPNPNNLPEVNHKNHIKDDNRLENLEWCTREYNLHHSNRRCKAIQCIETGKTYASIHEAARDIGADCPNLSSHLNYCKPKSVKKLHFKFFS